MMYSNMNKPSKNMLLSNFELAKMIREQQEELYAADQEQSIREASEYDRVMNNYYAETQARLQPMLKSQHDRIEFLQKVKEAFISECIMKLYCESMVAPMTKNDKIVARNLVNGFVKENGAGELINKFMNSNSRLLTEFGRISQKYYNKVIETDMSQVDNTRPATAKPGEVMEYDLPKSVVDDFYKDVADIDVSDASKMIKERVADAVQTFVDSNACAKMDYEEVIQQAQEKIASAKDESYIEEYSNIAKHKINEMRRTRPKNVFNLMVEALTNKVLTDQSYKTRFMHESKVDMDAIVDSVQLIYTMLEMVNTTNMVNVDEKFINGYIQSLA